MFGLDWIGLGKMDPCPTLVYREHLRHCAIMRCYINCHWHRCRQSLMVCRKRSSMWMFASEQGFKISSLLCMLILSSVQVWMHYSDNLC